MEYQHATLKDIPGQGYATVISEHARRRRCDGVFVTTALHADGRFLRGLGERTHFVGALYVNGLPQRQAFEVQITAIRTQGDEVHIRFMGFRTAGATLRALDEQPDAAFRSAA